MKLFTGTMQLDTIKGGNVSKTGVDRMEVRAIFRRKLVGKPLESSLVDCIADAVAEVIEENNQRLLQEITGNSKGRG